MTVSTLSHGVAKNRTDQRMHLEGSKIAQINPYMHSFLGNVKSKFVDQKKAMCTSASYRTRAASQVFFCQPRMGSDMILDILLLTKRRRCVSRKAEGATGARYR